MNLCKYMQIFIDFCLCSGGMILKKIAQKQRQAQNNPHLPYIL